MPEIDVLVGQVVPAIGAAVGAYGAGVLTRVEDEAAGATVRLGQRALGRILRRTPDPAPIEQAVGALAAAPDDAGALAVLRAQIRAVLLTDAGLAGELAGLAGLLPGASADGHGVAVSGNVDIKAEDHSVAAWSVGNVNIGNPPPPDPPRS